jgi:glycosyltransferase involved in cell wall biosynthesis
MSKKIGLGIMTYNRPDYFKKIFSSVPKDKVDELVVVNDGTPYDFSIDANLIQHETNKGIGISKNDAMKHLLDKGCEYIFLMEDDIIINDPNVFSAYINASEETGIQHFNYSQHGLMNKFPNSETPNPRVKIDYRNDVSVELYPHCVGAFCFYTKKCLDKVGLMDEKFYNATEHLEHTYNVIKSDMHPPFWWFADIANSNKYLSDIPWSVSTSTISSSPKHRETVQKGLNYFYEKHGVELLRIPSLPIDAVQNKLKQIYKNK